MTLAIPIYLTKTIKIMQDRKLFISLAAALTMAAGFTSCSNDDVLEGQPLDGRTPITLTSSVATRSVSQTLQDDQIAKGVNVGVFAQSNATAIENGDNNMLTADGAGAFTGTTMYFPEEGDVSIYAYAPYNSAWTGQLNSENEFTVPADQSTDDGYLAADLILGTPSEGNPVASTTGAIQLDFKHKLTKLNLDFNVGQSGVDLKGATVSVMNVVGTTTVNVGEGTIGNAQGNVMEITAAKFAADATTFSASAIFVPQAVLGQTDFVLIETADGTQYKAKLNKDVTFAEGKKYTYTAQFNGGGDVPVTVELKLGSVLDVWEDGNDDLTGEPEEAVVYGIGDYMLSDGTFVKNAELTDDQKSKVVAVIFSKQVSETDAEDGYNAYAMGLWRVKGKLSFQDVIVGSVDKFENVLADLDGREHTEAMLASQAYAGLGEDVKLASMLGMLEAYRTSHEITYAESSEWFIPAIGQLIQVVNNLGGATIDINTPVESGNYGSEWWKTEDKSAITNLNEYFTACGITAPLPDGGAVNVASSTEYKENLWGIQVKNKDGEGGKVFSTWGFGRGLNKNGQTDTSIIPCVAVKLPAVE